MTKQRMLLMIKTSIESNCFLLVHYNQADYTSHFFIRIKEICYDIKSRRLYFLCNSFSKQHHSDNEFDEIIIYFDKIISLETLKNETSYNYEKNLKDKLINDLDKLISFFSHQKYEDLSSLLDYYIEASTFDYSFLVQTGKYIPGIDLEILSKTKVFQLNFKQYDSLMDILIKRGTSKRNNVWLYLAELSIKIGEKNFPVVFHPFKFDLETAKLIYDETIHFNDLLNDDYANLLPVSLKYNATFEDFKSAYLRSKDEGISLLNIQKDALINLNPLCLVLEDKSNNFNVFQFLKLNNEQKRLSSLVSIACGFNENKSLTKNEAINFISLNSSQKEAINNSLEYPISYIFGPPGTGKSYTLVSFIIHSLFEKKRILVSANANHPLDEIENSLKSYILEDKRLMIPFFRLGNLEKIAESIDYIRMCYQEFKDAKSEYLPLNSITKFNDTNSIDLAKLRNLSYKHFTRLDNNVELLRIINYKDGENGGIYRAVKELKDYLRDRNNLTVFLNSFPIILSTCSSLSKLPLDFNIFDRVLLDEAASCPLASGLAPLIRAKQLTLCGDKKQLNAFTLIDEKINSLLIKQHNINPLFSYNNLSVLDFVALKVKSLPSCMLKEHYRCQKDIIEFCNQRFYENKMIIKTKSDGKKNHLFVYQIDSANGGNNTSTEECLFIIQYIIENNLDLEDVGIITPFVLQAKNIRKLLKQYFPNNYDMASVGTVHSFQGDQKKYMFFSLSCNKRTSYTTLLRFVSNSSLINVSISRAKNLFVAVGDFSLFDNLDPNYINYWRALKSYAKTNGTFKELEHKEIKVNSEKVSRNVSSLSKAESEFKQTLQQILTVIDGDFTLKTHVFLSSLIEDENIKEEYKNYHLDFLIILNEKNKYIGIELDGKEHESIKDKIRNDMKKDLLLTGKINMQLLRFKNEDRMLYTYIKELIKYALRKLNSQNPI